MCFDRYCPTGAAVTYHNIRRPFGRSLADRRFDAMLLPYDLLSLRSSEQWLWVMGRLSQLRSRCDQVIAFPQDDYTYNGVLDQSLADLGTEVIYTPIETGLEVVYPEMSKSAIIRTALTGYVDDMTVRSRNAYRIPMRERSIDVGQRVRMLPPWFGRSGADKGHFAELFARLSNATDLVTDISTDERDTFYGDDWYRFLGNCKATIGQKGGASLCDPNGSVMRKVVEYRTQNPDAGFDEIEDACFPGQDGIAVMKAISPRLFDAAMLHTVQILIEDDYLGVLEPWVHYIPTDNQLSNFAEIVNAVADDTLLDRIADAAAEVLIESGNFSYKAFAESVFNDISDSGLPHQGIAPPDLAEEIQWRITPELFEAVQRIAYQARATGSLPQITKLCRRVNDLLVEQPYLNAYLDADLLESISGPIELNRGIDSIGNPIVEVLVQCFRHGSLQSVIRWFAAMDGIGGDGWELLDWVDSARIRLDQGVRP